MSKAWTEDELKKVSDSLEGPDDSEKAAKLKKSGAIEDVVDAAPAVPTDAAERIAAIVDAIGKLDTANTSLWIQKGEPKGAPKTGSIEGVTGWPITGKERDTAWAQIEAGK